MYEGFDKEKLKQLVRELCYPVILSAESFLLVKEITKNEEAVLSQDFVQQKKHGKERIRHNKTATEKAEVYKRKYRCTK